MYSFISAHRLGSSKIEVSRLWSELKASRGDFIRAKADMDRLELKVRDHEGELAGVVREKNVVEAKLSTIVNEKELLITRLASL